MPAYAKAGRALASVAPRVDGGNGHVEVVGEVINREEPIEGFHELILRTDAFTPVATPCL